MQQKPESKHRGGAVIPMAVLILLGFLFFGVYLYTERQIPDGLPSLGTALLFLGTYAVFALITFFAFGVKEHFTKGEEALGAALNTKMHNVFKYTVGLPYAITDSEGKVRTVNAALQNILGTKDCFYHGNLTDFCADATIEDLIRAAAEADDLRTEVGRLATNAVKAESEEVPKPPAPSVEHMRDGVVTALSDGRRYVARAYPVHLNGMENYLVTFTDVSELLDLKEKMDRDMPAVAYIDVDNLEELTQYTHADYRDASRKVDDVLIQWTAEQNGFLREYDRDRYMLFFSQDKLRACEQDKFSRLLDGIRNIRLGEYGIPVTVSMGISMSDSSMSERAKEAGAALDMALQRGGDQVAVRRKEGIRYYGGQTRPFQRRTKVQSRVVANYLLTKISESDNLLIMGHRNPDFDSIASCVGVAQFGLLAGVPTKIIVDLDNPNFRISTERLSASRTYNDMFITGHEGLDLVRSNTLLVITDANNFDIIESPDVANSVRRISGRIVIIDHHRQTGEYDFEPIINYIDPSSSSAAELVTELLEQTETANEVERGKLITDEVASVILSGIMLDTNGFTRNTGSRTLDAARFLYSKGANAEYVHSFFNQNFSDFVCEHSFSDCFLMQDDTVGIIWSVGTGNGTDDRVAAAREADKLLSVKGISAAFALVSVENTVHISGRSDGTVNVQLILERLGGGGRFDSAGTALSGVSIEDAIEDLKAAVNAYFAELETSRRNAELHPVGTE